jgi:hypothetical protein
MTDDEIVEEIMSITRGDFRCMLMPELKEGEVRRMLTQTEFRQFRRSREYESLLDEHDIVIRLTLDGRWAVDIIAKVEDGVVGVVGHTHKGMEKFGLREAR